MSRKFLLATPIIAVTGLLALLIAQAANSNKVQNDNRQQLQLPFEAVTVKDFQTPSMQAGNPTVLVFFLIQIVLFVVMRRRLFKKT